MFNDEAEITVRSGDGGQGCVSFRREKFIPEGGPDGGDGGKGGDVIARASRHCGTLSDYVRKRTWKAPHGEQGTSRNCAGRGGEDLVLEVPCGTVIRLAETDEIIADLCAHGQEVVLAAGGRGGGGNTRYKSSTNRVPRKAGPGEPGVKLALRLELKLIADVGLVGLPNAGKSTLISRLSSARPKVADYPFTTLQPHLGVIEEVDPPVVVADIPGLIEGAADGVGLGHQFLRHVERCRVLVHLVDGSAGGLEELLARVRCIERELARFSPALAKAPRLMVLTKQDARPELGDLGAELARAVEREVLVISAVSGLGLEALRSRLVGLVHGDD